jgi:hypothetical protein
VILDVSILPNQEAKDNPHTKGAKDKAQMYQYLVFFDVS